MQNNHPLQPPEALLQGILNVFPGIVFLFDLEEKRYVFASNSVYQSLGYTPQEVIEMGPLFVKKIVPPQRLATKMDRFEKLKQLADNEIYTDNEKIICANGSYKWFNCRQTVFERDKNGIPRLILGVSYDVTEHIFRQDEIEKLALIAQKTTNAIIITDSRERIEWVNEGYEKLTGYTMAELLGKKPTFLLRENKYNQAAIQRIQKNFDTGTPFAEELVGYTKAGNEYWMRVFADPILAEDGKVIRYIAIAQNITELKQNEGRLMQSFERLKKFAFYTSHRLRSPVADILSILDVFDYENPLQGDNVRLLKDLKTVSLKLDEVIHELNEIVATDVLNDNETPTEIKTLNNILIIDDDPVFVNITGLILKRFKSNLQLKSFTDAVEALNSLQNLNPRPEIIFLDLNMPHLNGWQFLEEMEKLGLDIKVYILTSSIDPADLLKAKSYPNVQAYLTKPLSHSTLVLYFK